MKKVFLMLLSVMAIALTGCKIENAKVTVNVNDTNGDPVANRAVFYTDKASLILGAVLPATPEELMGAEDYSSWSYAETNKQGTVTFNVLMGVAQAKYYFLVYDEGAKDWVTKEVTLHRGENELVEFVVNK